MSFKLRPYQELAIENIRPALSKYKRIIALAPTGAGKTSITAYIARESQAKQRTMLFLAHRSELLTQAQERFASVGVVTGTPKAWHRLTNIASVQTMRNRTAQLAPPDIIVIDEAHLSMATSYRKVLDAYPNAYVIGLTATPRRLDGKSLGEIYKHIVPISSVLDLTAEGYLVPARYFAPKEVADLTGIATVAGDYATNQLFFAFDKKRLYDGVIANYTKNATQTSFICFCVNIAHSQATAKAFNDAGIKTEHIDGSESKNERERIVSAFRRGDITGICNVGLFTEGFDVPHLTVLGHGTNVGGRHGFHDDDREWSLTGKRKKSPGAYPVKNCPSCEAMLKVGVNTCPYCLYEYPAKDRENTLATAEEFTEITRPKILPQHLRGQWSKMTEDQLRELAEFRGYKPGWVYTQLKLQRK